MLFLNNRRKNKGKKIKAKDKKNFNCNLFVTSYKGNKKKGKKVICRNYFFKVLLLFQINKLKYEGDAIGAFCK